jgi:CHASE3 domain sensor protein
MDTFRQEYAELTDGQKEEMRAIKSAAQEFLTLLNQAVPQEERSERSRCMAIARTNLETTVMWAVKAVTTKQE